MPDTIPDNAGTLSSPSSTPFRITSSAKCVAKGGGYRTNARKEAWQLLVLVLVVAGIMDASAQGCWWRDYGDNGANQLIYIFQRFFRVDIRAKVLQGIVLCIDGMHAVFCSRICMCLFICSLHGIPSQPDSRLPSGKTSQGDAHFE